MVFQDVMAVIQTLALILGVGIGLCTLLRQKQDSKALSTFNMILHQRSDAELRRASSAIRDQDNVALLKNQAHRHYVFKILNLRETVAIGINQGVLDENIYKQTFYSLVLKDWEDLKAVVYATRKEQKNDTLFQDFERLVIRWQKHPLIKKI